MVLLRLVAMLWLLVAAAAWSREGVGEFVPGSPTERGDEILLIGDSWVMGVGDEPWAHYGDSPLSATGFVPRLRRAIGDSPSGMTPTTALFSGTGRVHIGSAVNTGTLFGPNADFDVISYVRANPKIHDVVFIIGANDYSAGGNCGHGTPFNPAAPASGTCAYTDTLANVDYLMRQLGALGVWSYFNVSPGLMSQVLFANAEAIAAVENLYADLTNTTCAEAANRCSASYAMYQQACRGVEIVDPAGGIVCNASGNAFNYGDGAGSVNRSNMALFFQEDSVHGQRSGFGVSRLHPSGWGYQRGFWVMMAYLAGTDATTGIKSRFAGINAITWDAKIPAIPTVTIGTVTATTIQVTPTTGTYVNGNAGTLGQCYKGECYFACWATCLEFNTSADPACATVAETDVARDLGAPMGAQHRAGESTTDSHRDVVVLRDGELGLLTGLTTATDYAVACVAVSPTTISHPGVRNQATQ